MGNWFTVSCAAALCVYMVWYVMSGKSLPKSGSWRGWFCPSVVTASGVLISLLAYFVGWVLFRSIELTMLCFTFGAVQDAVDGKIARQNGSHLPCSHSITLKEVLFVNFREWFFFPGTSELGAILDSTLDKVKIILIYGHAAWIMVDTNLQSLLFYIVGIEFLAGTERLVAFKYRFGSGVNHSGWIGKVKAWVQLFCMIPLLFVDVLGTEILATCLKIALGFTLASPIFRIIQAVWSFAVLFFLSAMLLLLFRLFGWTLKDKKSSKSRLGFNLESKRM